MLLLVLAAVTAQPAAPVAVTRQVRATVRIVSAPPLRFKEIEQRSPQMLRDAKVRALDGSLQPARLVEFQ
jgi:hypothetical protein